MIILIFFSISSVSRLVSLETNPSFKMAGLVSVILLAWISVNAKCSGETHSYLVLLMYNELNSIYCSYRSERQTVTKKVCDDEKAQCNGSSNCCCMNQPKSISTGEQYLHMTSQGEGYYCKYLSVVDQYVHY